MCVVFLALYSDGPRPTGPTYRPCEELLQEAAQGDKLRGLHTLRFNTWRGVTAWLHWVAWQMQRDRARSDNRRCDFPKGEGGNHTRMGDAERPSSTIGVRATIVTTRQKCLNAGGS